MFAAIAFKCFWSFLIIIAACLFLESPSNKRGSNRVIELVGGISVIGLLVSLVVAAFCKVWGF